MTEATKQHRGAARRQVRRQAILHLASVSFLDRGYAATSMSAIAAQLGGSKTTLWSHFESKAALFEAVLEHETAAYRKRLADILDPRCDLPTTLLSFCESFLETVSSPTALALRRLVQAEAPRFPWIGEMFYERAPRMTHEMVMSYLEESITAKRLAEGNPAVMARHLIGLCLSGSYQRRQLGLPEITTAALRIEAADAVGMFLKAYASGRPRFQSRD